MVEYIERDAAIMTAMNYTGDGNAQDASQDIAGALSCIPVADVKPIVRGKWKDAVQGAYDSPHVLCSICGEYFWRYFKNFDFCPNCGANMKEEKNEPKRN